MWILNRDYLRVPPVIRYVYDTTFLIARLRCYPVAGVGATQRFCVKNRLFHSYASDIRDRENGMNIVVSFYMQIWVDSSSVSGRFWAGKMQFIQMYVGKYDGTWSVFLI